jgi:hypothetical protein
MNDKAIIETAIEKVSFVRDFQRLFPNAEHVIVQGKRDFDPDGWKTVNEWISRTALFNRYVLWLVAAIDISKEGEVSLLEEPDVYLVGVESGEKSDDGYPTWEIGFFQFEEGDWNRFVKSDGNFSSLELEITTDAPIDGFDIFWNKTRPQPGATIPDDGMAFKAPFRFLMGG